MYQTEKNTIEFRLWGKYALFSDPLTKMGGEKCSYHIPTYEALKGVCKSIYWKPTLIWIVDEVRVMKQIRTQSKGTKLHRYETEQPDLSYYTFLHDVEYQVRVHFEFNQHQPNLKDDWVDGKHFAICNRVLETGGRQDIFLGTRDCQGYVEPCVFGEGIGAYDGLDEMAYGLMFHGFDYPDENGKHELWARFWRPVLRNGRIRFERPESIPQEQRKFVRPMTPKTFGINQNVKPNQKEAEEMGVTE